ncbi:MAG: hypothetical protein ABR530_06740 [Pyrinomonadaceae bacterium]
MRVRTQLIIADDLLARIDEIAGEKHRRSVVVETALREYVAREDRRRATNAAPEGNRVALS